MKKSVIFLSFVLCATLLIGNVAFGIDEEKLVCDDGQPVGPSASSITINSSKGPGSLTTIFTGGNGYAGNMFDIVPNFDMFINAIDVNIDAVGETALIDVYWKDGTATGFETSPADWTHLGTFSGTGAGANLPTWIDMYGNGKTFVAGQTYGIYVHLQNYATITGNMNYTNGAPTVYSNADLTLTTWCGTTDPAFNSFFADRMWNGTIYYDDPAPLAPRTIVWVNGGQNPVNLYEFENVKVDVQVDAFSGMGIDHDVWIFILPPYPFGIFSYTPTGWVYGLVPYSSGPLADINMNIIDQPLFAGGWLPVCAVDDVADGIPNTNDIVDMAYIPVKINPFNPVAMSEDFDDGVADNWIDDGAHWSVPVDSYYLDCPSYARFVSYYDGSAYADFTYTADLYQEDTGNASMTYDFGMFFRSDGTLNNGYDFYAEPDGSVFLYVRVGGSGTQLYTNSLSPYWNVGFDVWNTVSVDVRGSTIDIYINGNLEASVTDTTYTWGYIGLTGQGSGSYDQNFYFDNVSVIL